MTSSVIEWDGITNSYIPPDVLRLPPQVALHSTADDDVDPVTAEVLKYNLWNINEENADTIIKVSGSPITVFSHDFNPSILTEDGEFVYFGPYLQFHAGMLDVNVKWTLENRGENPGIHDGDMFLSNDPWVGTTHQPDAALICPVFVDGKIFCWVGAILHLADVGGSTPGSFCPDAEDFYQEPIPMPPVKLVEKGVVRRDIEEQFVRRSRLPGIVQLDLRSVIAGNSVARNRITGLVERYGADVVKGVMGKIQRDGEQRFTDRLESCSDGTWTTTSYLDVAKTGDRGTYKSVLTLTKEGDHLVFGNQGTAPQTGAINMTFAPFRGGVLSCLNALFLHDAMYAIGGAARHVEFDLEPGTVTCATAPAACSLAGAIGVHMIMGQALNALSKMMMTSPTMRERVMAQGGVSQWPGATCSGKDQRGQSFGGFMLDAIGAGIGAFATRDGVDCGGMWFDPKGYMPNVEQAEHTMPILYLYRKEIPDSGGAGKYRGGNAGEWAFVAHKTTELSHATSSCGCAVPPAVGLAGGRPGAPNSYRMLRESDIQRMFAVGKMPSDLTDIDGSLEFPHPKEVNIRQTAEDCYAIRWAAAAGFGDPLERDADSVAADVAGEDVSPETAESVYGVVLDDDGAPDPILTAELRDRLMASRKQEAVAQHSPS